MTAATSRSTIPAKPDYLVLARLALSAVCRLTPLSPEEVADLKLAITEAANDFVDETRGPRTRARLNFSFRLGDDALRARARRHAAGPSPRPSRSSSRAIIEATVDESEFADGRTRLVKYLSETG